MTVFLTRSAPLILIEVNEEYDPGQLAISAVCSNPKPHLDQKPSPKPNPRFP